MRQRRVAFISGLATAALAFCSLRMRPVRQAVLDELDGFPARSQVLIAADALLALTAGVLVGVLTLGLLRWAQPRWLPTAPRWPGGFPWKRLGVTLLAPLALLAGARIPPPGVDVEWLTARIAPDTLNELPLHATALGLMPVLTAFVVVEGIALAIPALRWRRHDPRGRRGLTIAVAVGTIALALAQGFFLSRYLTNVLHVVGRDAGLTFQLGVAAALACGAVLLAVLARIIDEHGLGSGYGVLAACGAFIPMAHRPVTQPLAIHVPQVMALIAAMGITVGVLRWRVGGEDDEPGLRLPTSSLVPLLHAGGLLLLFGTLSGAGLFHQTMNDVLMRVQMALATPWSQLAFILGLVALWSWLLARPSLLAATARAAGLAPPSMATWARATALSAAMSGAVAMIYLVVPGTADLVSMSIAMFATAAVMDVLADARALRAPLATIVVLHQVQRSHVVARILEEAAIPFHLRGAHLRTLLAFFGPYVPVTVLVPAEHGERARALLAALRAPPAQAMPAQGPTAPVDARDLPPAGPPP